MKKIAILGSGISGLTCAYLLDKKYNVTLFEKNDYLGGHTATVDIVHENQAYAIDTGFIVFNDKTYPNFNRLLEQLGLKPQATEMSFSVHNKEADFEYNGHGINALFAQRKNIVSLQFWRFLIEIIRFNKMCKKRHHQGDISPEETLGEFLQQHNFSAFFNQHYILPMGAAIWSTSLKEMEQFELKFFIRFFFNHGLLNITDRPQWHVVPGGSRKYVDKIVAQLTNEIVLNANIHHVSRNEDGVLITMADGDVLAFDEVIFACHSDQALALLSDASASEKEILSAIPYSRNEVVLHTDTQLLPKRKLAWASWNYLLDSKNNRPACVTYNMNILQGIESPTTFCVTLNQTNKIDMDKIIRQFVYHHPVLNSQSVAAQKKREQICGHHHTHFVGAYWYSGFHEDGVRSALDVTKRFGVEL